MMNNDDFTASEWIKQLTENKKLVSIESASACRSGENFSSAIRRVKIHCEDTASGGVKILSVILKERLAKDEISTIVDSEAMYANEIVAYTKFLPVLKEAIGEDKWMIPRCIFASDEYLILEDLQPLQFLACNAMEGLRLNECQLVMRALASFHAGSMIVKHRNPEKFSTLSQSLSEPIFQDEGARPMLNALWENSFWIGCKSLQRCNDANLKEIALMLENDLGSVFSIMRDMIQSNDKFAVLSHGDLWINNLMFRFDDDAVSSLKIIDWQVIRVSSCALDLLHILCTSSAPKLLSENLDNLVQIYYNEFKSTLLKFDIDIQFSLEELRTEMLKRIKYGIIYAFMMLRVATCDVSDDIRQDVPYMTTEEWREECYSKMSPVGHLRIRQMICDLNKNGYI